jgi:hypothetical protein
MNACFEMQSSHVLDARRQVSIRSGFATDFQLPQSSRLSVVPVFESTGEVARSDLNSLGVQDWAGSEQSFCFTSTVRTLLAALVPLHHQPGRIR